MPTKEIVYLYLIPSIKKYLIEFEAKIEESSIVDFLSKMLIFTISFYLSSTIGQSLNNYFHSPLNEISSLCLGFATVLFSTTFAANFRYFKFGCILYELIVKKIHSF